MKDHDEDIRGYYSQLTEKVDNFFDFIEKIIQDERRKLIHEINNHLYLQIEPIQIIQKVITQNIINISALKPQPQAFKNNNFA